MVVAGALTSVWALYQCLSFNTTQWTGFMALVGLVLLTGWHPIRIPGTTVSVTAGDTFVFLSVLLLNVPAAIVLGVLDTFVCSCRTTQRAATRLGASAIMSVTVFISGTAFYCVLALDSRVTNLSLKMATTTPPVETLLAGLVLMTISQYLLNGLSVSAMYALRNHRSIWGFWREGHLWTILSFITAAICAALLYGAINNFGLVYVLPVMAIMAATYTTYKIYSERLNSKTHEASEMSRLHLATVEALATAIDAKDQTTHCHVRRVQIFAAGMGHLFGLSEREIEALKAGALLHDIGKLAVPDHILNKPGRLTSAEFEKMKVHTTVGAEILERVGFPYPVVPIVLYHHEQWDGRGYPEGLKGEEIPLTARILSVVDCFDSAREERPYRRGMTSDEACAMLRRGAGGHFDPQVVEVFLRHLPRFEEEINAEGLDNRGLTNEEWEHRDLLGEEAAPEQRVEAASHVAAAATPHRSDATSYLNQITNAHREVYALYEIARTFGSSLDIEDTVSVLVNKVGHIVPFDLCAVYLYDEEKGYATAAHVAGRHAEALRGRAVAPGEGVVGFVLANRRASFLLDPMLDFREVLLPEGYQFRSMVALPLMKDERVLGALVVYSSEPSRYNDDHLRLLDTVARLASDALSNAMSHAEAASNALTDTLTGLPNARAMYVRFEQEVARARRSGRPFQVVMLDLDEFKAVNDTFGHKTGDRMLREVGRIIGAQLREYDFLARYAGDEFVAIVQDLSTDQTNELRERIERAVSRFALHVRGDKHARVGISVGSASYGVHGETLDQLLIAADEAMYSVKSLHRQRTPDTQQPPDAKPSNTVELTTGDLASTAIN